MITKEQQRDRIVTDYRKLFEEKAFKRDNMNVAAQFFEPDDETLAGNKVLARAVNETEDRILLDTTVIKVVKDYVSSVLGLSFFQASRWFSLEHNKIPSGSDQQKVLDARADVLYKLIKNTNYHQQIVPFEFDIVGYGHGLFVIDEDKDCFAKCYAKNPYDVVFLADVYGGIYKTMWEQSYDLKSLLDAFPSLIDMYDPNKEPVDKAYEVICSFFELHPANGLTDEDKEKKANGYTHALKYVLRDGSGLEKELKGPIGIDEASYFKSEAVMGARDIITRGSPYGKGVFRDLIPKARILNALAYGELEMVAQQYNPAMYMESDIYEITGNNKIKSGARFIRKLKNFTSGAGDRPLEILKVTGDLNAVNAIKIQQQSEVADTLPTAANIYKTSRQSVEEIHQRMSNEEKKLAPLRSNYAKEAIEKHIRRFYEIADRNGYFKGPNLELEDKSIDISAKSKDMIFDGFLLQKYREGVVRRILQALNSASILAPTQPQAFAYLNGDKILKTLFDNLEVFDQLKSDEQVRVERERTVELAERQQQREDQKIAGEGVGDLAKMAEVLRG